jgi:hypothetical protein
MNMSTYFWPDVFISGIEVYEHSTAGKLKAIADGLLGWANCMAGQEPPENFGKGMVCIFGATGTADCKKLSELADELLEKRNQPAK